MDLQERVSAFAAWLDCEERRLTEAIRVNSNDRTVKDIHEAERGELRSVWLKFNGIVLEQRR